MPIKSRQSPGLNHVPEYQVSGHTYIVARDNATRVITLNYIPSEVTIIAESTGLEVEFEDSTTPTTIKRSVHLTKGSHTFRIKCKKIKFVGNNTINHSAVVACTGIPVIDYNPIIYDVLAIET